MNKIKNKSGLTLLEIIISLAIVSIMIVPIGSMLRMSISTNKKNDIKQYSTLLGQEIIEEIEILQSIDKNQLKLSNMTLKPKDFNTETALEYYIKNYSKDNLDIEVIVKSNTDVNYDYDYNYSYLDNSLNGKLKLYINSNNIKIDDAISDKFIASFNRMTEEPMNISIVAEQSKINLLINEDTNNKIVLCENKNIDNLKLMMYLTNEYKNPNLLKVDINNQTGIPMELLIKKSYDSIGDIEVSNMFGKLTIYDNLRDINEIDSSRMENLYNINVKIKNKNKVLFEGNLNKNLKILN